MGRDWRAMKNIHINSLYKSFEIEDGDQIEVICRHKKARTGRVERLADAAIFVLGLAFCVGAVKTNEPMLAVAAGWCLRSVFLEWRQS